jgi:hypothetical protein
MGLVFAEFTDFSLNWRALMKRTTHAAVSMICLGVSGSITTTARQQCCELTMYNCCLLTAEMQAFCTGVPGGCSGQVAGANTPTPTRVRPAGGTAYTDASFDTIGSQAFECVFYKPICLAAPPGCGLESQPTTRYCIGWKLLEEVEIWP